MFWKLNFQIIGAQMLSAHSAAQHIFNEFNAFQSLLHSFVVVCLHFAHESQLSHFHLLSKMNC